MKIIISIMLLLGLSGCFSTGGSYSKPTTTYKPKSNIVASWYTYDADFGGQGSIIIRKIDDSRCQSGYQYIIYLKGAINPDTSHDMKQAISRTNAEDGKCRYWNSAKQKYNYYAIKVYMVSDGGNAFAGEELGRTFRQEQIQTIVNGICASSCSYAFVGGKYRYITNEGWLGFHSAYNIKTDHCAKRWKDISREYYKEMLGSSLGNRLANFEERYCGPTEMGWLDKSNSVKAGLAKGW